MAHSNDTIAALATPAGTSAIALIRISGIDALSLMAGLFSASPAPRVATLGHFRDRSGSVLDQVIFTRFQSPESYTGEDSLEISCHGNPFIVQAMLEDLFGRGCRPAEPGEFTQRAFLNGRMDLCQAEAVMDVIHARSERALAAAQFQLRGALGRQLGELTEGLLGALARIEAYIDFPDEDLPAEDRLLVEGQIEGVLTGTRRLLATSHYGELLRGGIRTVIVGEPNAGKSSLLNRLIGRDRAIVSPEPGTTRDFLEEPVIIGPHGLRLIDTAGLNSAPGSLEKLGIDKTFERIEEADLHLMILDSSRPTPLWPNSLRQKLTPANTLFVLNKSDLSSATQDGIPDGFRSIKVSALTGDGLELLRVEIARLADGLAPGLETEGVAINARHAHALARVREALENALQKVREHGPGELVASDVRAGLQSLGEIGGRIDNERMLDQLFRSFCIGK